MSTVGQLVDGRGAEVEPVDLDQRIKRVDPRTVPARFSHLKAMARSGAHAFEAFQGDGDDSLSRRLGAGVHAMLFGRPWALWDQPSKAARTGKSKATGKKPSKAPRSGGDWEVFLAAHQGHVIMTGKEHARAVEIAAAIRRSSMAARLLLTPGVIHEQTILWRQDGRDRRSTPDARGAQHVAELKTTRDASPDRFSHDARRMAYHAQVADQCSAIEAATGRRPHHAYIVAVETVRPYVVQVYELSKGALEQGAALIAKWLDALKTAEATDSWNGYHLGAVELDVPTDPGSWFGDEEPGDGEEQPLPF